VAKANRLRGIAEEYGLTDRQSAVLQLLLKGYTSAEIGTLLEIATRTVDNHVQIILKKVGVSRRSQLQYDLLDRDPGL
jgi:DNA-binding CsgD family transcriptional regulator